MSASLENALEYLKIQERLRTKISQSIIYVKEYFYMFFSAMKDIMQYYPTAAK